MLPLLVVCTGNICRSPAAQLLLADALDDSVSVSSAGTRAVVDAPVAEPVARRLAAAGLVPAPFAARALTSALVRESEVVLTMTAAHRAAVLDVAPGALRRTFLLSELTLLAERAGSLTRDLPDDAARLRALVTGAGRVRATLGTVRAHDVEDPYGQSEAVHDRVLTELTAQVGRLVHALRS